MNQTEENTVSINDQKVEETTSKVILTHTKFELETQAQNL